MITETTQLWLARAEQARRLAHMLTQRRDAEALEDYAEECRLRAGALAGAEAPRAALSAG